MNKLLIFLALFSPWALNAENIKGNVLDNSHPLSGASIYWLGAAKGTTSDKNGMFEIQSLQAPERKLVISFIGYKSDTLIIKDENFLEVKLQNTKALKEVIVKSVRPGTYISSLNPIKTEVISKIELTKSACCDLSGCFETHGTVQAVTTNVVTNSKELRILGLSGIYNQVLIDGMPLIQGLSYTYGISSIPGTLVESISVSKGANSVLQGYESISGQINVDTKDPDNTEKLLLNVYTNNFMEKQLNANYAFKKNKWSNLIAFQTVQPANKFDGDQDTFLDVPLVTRYMLFNKWKYGDEKKWGWSSSIGIRYLNEQRIGGQTFFDAENDKGTTNAYGQTVDIQQPEFWTKTGYRYNDNHKITLIASALHQDQNSYFGTTKYVASQTNVYANLQYELSYKEKHILKTGISYRQLAIGENIGFTANPLSRTYAGDYKKLEKIPGVFAENTFNWNNNKLVWITGIRLDHHNEFGYNFTPRTLLKYDITEGSTIRASVGTGWRTVNLFSENNNLLASSRNIVFLEQLKPEKAVNYGLNYTQKFATKYAEGYVAVDFYRTQFQNQIFPDYDTDPTKALISNFTGTSVSNGFQVELFTKYFNLIEVKSAYNYLDVYYTMNGEKIVLPFNSTHKTLTTISYKPITNKWHVDLNMHWFGKQRLPNTSNEPIEFQRPDQSQPYTLFNAQFTKNWKKFEVYLGCENIFDFRQNQPIIGWQNPFGPYFDTSSVWGPTKGREVYIGIRFKIM